MAFSICKPHIPINFQSVDHVIGATKINIDEINARQDQILNELDELDRKISDIIELWTKTETEPVEELEKAA